MDADYKLTLEGNSLVLEIGENSNLRSPLYTPMFLPLRAGLYYIVHYIRLLIRNHSRKLDTYVR